eukprot:scaffold2113_cov63-Attheya_sp.AAC.5
MKQHVLCWRLFLEQYGCTFTYIPGPDNVIANVFPMYHTLRRRRLILFAMTKIPRSILWIIRQFNIINKMMNAYKQQQNIYRLSAYVFKYQTGLNYTVIVYQKELNVPWQIALPDAILDCFI